jgi:undecaprenyl-diphosphatase
MDNSKSGRNITILIFFILGIISFFYDSSVNSFFKSVQNPWLTGFFKIFDSMILMLVVYAILIFLIWKKTQFKWSIPFGITLILTIVISSLIKLLVMRNRPDGLIEMIPLLNLIDYSFPSNHTSVIFSTLPILEKGFKKLKYIWIVFAILMAVSRLYLGVHYLSDVIFGGILGYLVGLSVLSIKEKYFKK